MNGKKVREAKIDPPSEDVGPKQAAGQPYAWFVVAVLILAYTF